MKKVSFGSNFAYVDGDARTFYRRHRCFHVTEAVLDAAKAHGISYRVFDCEKADAKGNETKDRTVSSHGDDKDVSGESKSGFGK